MFVGVCKMTTNVPKFQQSSKPKSNVVLSVKNLTKTFNDRIAVNNISFEIHEGEIFGFLGPNGAGKSTTMKMICGLMKPTRGAIYICGHNLNTAPEKALANMGGLIETPLMYTYMSGYDNLKYYASLHGNISKKDILNYAKVVGLQNRLKDKVGTYSLGMRQRLGICQALLHNPKLLVLDEPISGLDPSGVKEMRDFLKHLAKRQRIGIMVSSHMLGEMEHLCDTICILNKGSVLEVKTLNQLKEGQADSKKVKISVDYPNFAGKIIINELHLPVDVAGNCVVVKADESSINKITEKLISYNISIFGIETVYKPLEEVFLDIISAKNKGINSIF